MDSGVLVFVHSDGKTAVFGRLSLLKCGKTFRFCAKFTMFNIELCKDWELYSLAG